MPLNYVWKGMKHYEYRKDNRSIIGTQKVTQAESKFLLATKTG